jgi:hypothetical protein
LFGPIRICFSNSGLGIITFKQTATFLIYTCMLLSNGQGYERYETKHETCFKMLCSLFCEPPLKMCPNCPRRGEATGCGVQQLAAPRPMKKLAAKEPMKKLAAPRPMKKLAAPRLMKKLAAPRPMKKLAAQKPMKKLAALRPTKKLAAQKPMKKLARSRWAKVC